MARHFSRLIVALSLLAGSCAGGDSQSTASTRPLDTTTTSQATTTSVLQTTSSLRSLPHWAPDGFEVVNRSFEGFSFAIPTEWSVSPIAGDELTKWWFETADEVDPEFEDVELVEWAQSAEGHLLALAPNDDYAIVLTYDRPPTLTWDDLYYLAYVTPQVYGGLTLEARHVHDDQGQESVRIRARYTDDESGYETYSRWILTDNSILRLDVLFTADGSERGAYVDVVESFRSAAPSV